MWRRPRTPGAFYVQARPAAHLDPRYDVGADDVGEGPGAWSPHLLCELRGHPSIVSRWKARRWVFGGSSQGVTVRESIQTFLEKTTIYSHES